jgi:hypothetical protein
MQMPEYNIPKFKKRSLVMDFLQIPLPEDPNTKEWMLLGTGFDQVNRAPNAQTMTTQFVNEDSASEITTAYQETYACTIYEVSDEILIETILDVSRKRLIGEGTIFPHRRVYVNNVHRDPVTGVQSISPKRFKSFEQLVNISVADENPRDNLLGATINLNSVSDFRFGAYDPEGAVFTPDAA